MNNLKTEKKESCFIVIVNRPDKLNALNGETLNELKETFETINADDTIRCVIITGEGQKAFVAGADIKELSELDSAGAKRVSEFGQSVFQLIENCSKPVIAAVNGFALGGGLELALSAHFRIASKNAKFGLPEVSLGLIPGYGGTQRLAREIGRGRATQMIVSADMITAEQAYQWGLINVVTEQEELMDTAYKIVQKVSEKSPIAIAYALKAIHFGYEHPEQDVFTEEAKWFSNCFDTADMKEGVGAFLEKRAAQFQGK